MTTVQLTKGLRASSLRDCPRRAIFEATDAPARERTDREQRTMFRGQSIGHDFIVMLASSNNWRVWVDSGPNYWLPPELAASSRESADVVAELIVRWKHGRGHADAFIVSTGTVVECLSSAHASDAMIRSKLLQAVIYCEHVAEATNCRLVVIDPGDLSEEQVVLSPKSEAYRSLVAEMHERIGEIDAWLEDGPLPQRVCSKPSESISHFCPFATHCFEGWTAPEPDELDCDETLADTLATFDRVKRERADLGKLERALKTEQDDAQKILEGLELPVGTVRLGPFEVTRTFTQRKDSFEWEKAEMAGVFEPGLYGDFFRAGSSYSTFKTVRVDDSGDEFGSEAPWSDADLEESARS